MTEVGELLAGRYMLRELLVSGPRGRGFRARDLDVDDTVVVFVLDAASSEAEVEQLREQVRVARRLTHRNIARMFDIGEHGGRRFVTLEYIDGQRVRTWVRGQGDQTRADTGGTAPGLAARLDIAAQLADALAAAHAQGIVHGSVAPEQVMVDRRGRAVLGNFGVAGFEMAETLVPVDGHAGPNSADCLAPEQVLGHAATSASDVYALGLLVYELVVGQPRYVGNSPVAIASARLDDTLGDLLDPRTRDPRIPAALAAVLVRVLARAPEQRPDAATLARELRTIVQQAQAPARVHDSLAVLPFRYRGPQDSAYLATVLTDELVDLLAQTRGLRVLGAGVAARQTALGERDPKQLGRELGVDVIVDGTLVRSGERLRISARMLEAADGFQLWHERFEGSVVDVFELQDKLAKRIAEALRCELGIIAQREQLDAETLEHYLRGRHAHLRWNLQGPGGALAHYHAVLERAPQFKPALAHLALANVLAWFQIEPERGRDWGAEVERSVTQALKLAPELAETQLAAGNFAAIRDDHQTAAQRIWEALRIAPTFAMAHELLGRLLLESGRSEAGIEHLELAVELDHTRAYCLADIARHHALHGGFEPFQGCVARLLALVDHHRPSIGMLLMRVGAWTRDRDMIETGLAHVIDDGPRSAPLRRFGELLLGPPSQDPEAVVAWVRNFGVGTSPRRQTLVEQLLAEEAAYRGRHDVALAHIGRAAELVLIDLEWIDHCPLFEPLRGRAEYAAARGRVWTRCEQLWDGLG